MLFFRIFQHLLPDALAWRIKQSNTPWFIGDGSLIGQVGLLIGSTVGGRIIDRFFQGLTTAFVDVKTFADDVYSDIIPEKTRQLTEYEEQFGLLTATTEAARRENLATAWASTGGQSSRYLQDRLRGAGFDVFIHEWFGTASPPYVAIDPRLHTNVPLIGTVQCGESFAQCGDLKAVNNGFLANEVDYIVNSNLSPFAPPPVPSDEAFWPFFLYWGGEIFPARASVPPERRAEFEQLILKLCPTQNWLVTLVDYP